MKIAVVGIGDVGLSNDGLLSQYHNNEQKAIAESGEDDSEIYAEQRFRF